MELKKLDSPVYIPTTAPVRFKETGNVTEIMYSEKHSIGGYIEKIDKDHYVDKRTGEMKEFKHIENRSQDTANVAKSLARLRDLLNTNVVDVSRCRWLTLTYASNMTDPKKLMRDFMHFNERCRAIFGNYEYITAAEPQGRGAWHLHVVLIFPQKAPYMENAVVRDCWKQGFVTVRQLDSVDNVGAYLTAYLGDMELSEVVDSGIDFSGSKGIKEVECVDSDGKKQTKRYIKGARLWMYPPGFRIYRYSKGIQKPVVSRISYAEAKAKVGSSALTYSKTVLLQDEEKGFKNTMQYESYNKARRL